MLGAETSATREFTNNKWQQQGATDNESDLICHGAGICSEGVTFTGNMSVDQPSGPTNGQFIFCGPASASRQLHRRQHDAGRRAVRRAVRRL